MGKGLHSREGLEHSGRADLGCPGQAGRPQSGWPRVQGTEVKVEVRPSRGRSHRPWYLAVPRASLTLWGRKCRGKKHHPVPYGSSPRVT